MYVTVCTACLIYLPTYNICRPTVCMYVCMYVHTYLPKGRLLSAKKSQCRQLQEVQDGNCHYVDVMTLSNNDI